MKINNNKFQWNYGEILFDSHGRTIDKLFQTRFEFVSSVRREGLCVPTREAIWSSQTEKPLRWVGWNFFTRLIPNISVNIDLFLRKSSLRLYSFRIVSAKMNLKEQYKTVRWMIGVKKIWNMKIASSSIKNRLLIFIGDHLNLHRRKQNLYPKGLNKNIFLLLHKLEIQLCD